jgi:hypothetical protein
MHPLKYSQAPTGRRNLIFFPLVFIFLALAVQLAYSPLVTHRTHGESYHLEEITPPSQTYTAISASVPGVFSLPVIQQPEDKVVYIANRPGMLTQFQLASQNGIIGLMAHNYLSGKDFYKLGIGQEVNVVYNDHRIGHYQVTSIRRFQKLRPSRLYSDFVDLDTRQRLTTGQVFDQFYRGESHVIFQTCLEGEGRMDWGIIFIVASPLSE